MANLVTPRFWKKKAVLLKSEVTYGTDSTPTGAANWIEARNVNLSPMDPETVERNIDLPYLGSTGKVLVAKWAKLSFEVVMAGSGTAGTAPKWAVAMLGAGFAETVSAGVSAAYNLISTSFGSLTAWINIDGVYHKLVGARGNVKGRLTAKGIPTLMFEIECLYVAPVDAAVPAVTRTGWGYDEGVNSVNTTALTINGVATAFSSLEWDVGNQLSRIDLPGPQKEVSIVDRKPTCSATILAPLLAVFNPFALADAGSIIAISATHGSVAGKKVKNDLNVTISNVEYDQIENMVAYRLTLDPQPVSGNDEITVTSL